jgi:hypothetical protein
VTEHGKGAQEQAVEILQTAAIEAIKAMRSFLDIAETLVREPETAAVVGKAFAEAAASALRPRASGNDDDGEPDDAAPTGRVRRIDVTD